MGKQYSAVSEDVLRRIERLREKHYAELEGVTICGLFVFNGESEHVLMHHGYPALAVIKKTPTVQRAAGLADALLVIDRYTWSSLVGAQMDAAIDHELHHLVRELDDAGKPTFDSVDRPKISIRLHDHNFGWFDEIAARHGAASIEVMQASALMKAAGQLYFDFSDKAA